MAERILFTDLVRNASLALTNRVRLLRRRQVGYVVLRVGGAYPERTSRPRRRFPLSLLPWPPPPPSVEAFTYALECLAHDPRVRGVVFIISGLSTGPATLSSLRLAVTRFRASGKQAVAFLHDLDMWSYYLASACDLVLAPESATFHAAGLRSETVFLKDALALLGVQADFEAIAEYKVAPDTFRRAEMTEPHREMLDSLLDSVYGEVVQAVAEGRDMTVTQIQQRFDSVPLTAEQALEAGLLDALSYEDELPARLGTDTEPASLVSWDQARRLLIRPLRWQSHQVIGVISLEGMIVPGPSRRPPLPLPLPLPIRITQTGSDTLSQQLRAAAADRRVAAVLLIVDSPGGSSLASDLIWREVTHLRQVKPIVIYMSNQAASGGYYVAAAANAIFAQPMSLTGSIGIWGGKIVTSGLFDKVGARREVVSRGKAAGLYADTAPFSPEERDRIRASIGAGYARFKARVASGRGMSDEQVESIARGRVWTGEQALDNGLVDELGDLKSAADRARQLAGLDPRRYSSLVSVLAPKQYHLPVPDPSGAAAWLEGLTRLANEGVYALAPWEIRFR